MNYPKAVHPATALARELSGRFGARAYAAEELGAELGAAFVLADLGIARAMRYPAHAVYCASWAPLLRADPHAFSYAATQASQAADYLAALHREHGAGVGEERTSSAIGSSQ